MPLYEYRCEACGTRFERIRKFSDPPLDTCPACGAGPVEKLLSSPAIQFKGSGWYITDYARKGGDAGATNGSGAKAAAAGDAKPESKAEQKPETRTDTKTESYTKTESKRDAKAD